MYCVEVLGKCAYTQPQEAYAAFVLSLQTSERMDIYTQIVPSVGPLFAPIEVVIRLKCIQPLLGILPSELSGELRHVLSLHVKLQA